MSEEIIPEAESVDNSGSPEACKISVEIESNRKKTKTEIFHETLESIPDSILIEKISTLVTELCSSGGKKWTLHVPPRVDDPDMIILEMVRRFKNLTHG